MKKAFLQFGNTVFLALIISLASGTVFAQTCPAGMIGYWKMAETLGPTYFDSYDNHNASAPTVSPNVVPGASGGAQNFDLNKGTYLAVQDHAAFDWTASSSFTIEFWVKYSGTTGNVQVFVGRDDRPYSAMTWWIGANTNGTMSWYLQGTTGANSRITTATPFNNNQWHHVVAVRNGSTARNYLYIDNVLQNPGGTSFSSFGTLYSSNPITFGGLLYVGKADFFTTGAIDEIAIYSTALDPVTDIATHYSNIAQYQIGYCDGDDPVFISEPVTKTTVGQLYTYDVDASGNSKPTYALIEKPDGMIINSTTGMITWTPVTQSVNGRVVVRATNNKGFVDQNFFVSIADAPLCRPNLLSYWDFDMAGTAGYIDKIAGWELTGKSPSTTTGIIGSALSFNGINDSLNLHDRLGPTGIFFDFREVGSFSFEVWMKSNASPSKNMVILGREQPSNNTQYWLGIKPSGAVAFYLRDYPAAAVPVLLEGGSVLDGQWHHIVGTYNDNSTAVQLYVDNVLVDDAFEGFTDFGGNTPLNIGHLNTPVDKYWYDGIIDEVGIYNMALTPAQISENYSNALSGQGGCTFNYAPIIISSPDSTVLQEALYSYEIVAMDGNTSDILTISLVSAPSWLDSFYYIPGDSTATISGTPGNDDVGFNDVTVRAFDGKVNVDQDFRIRVINVNDSAHITSTPLEIVNQNANYSYKITAIDPDGDVLTYSAPGIPGWLTFNAGSQTLSGIPGNEDVGVHDITLRVSDGAIEIDQDFQITVNNVNDPPEFSSDPVTTAKVGTPYLYQIEATDPDMDDELTFTANIMPDWLILTPASNIALLTGTPQLSDVGSHAVIVKVSDGEKDDLQTFTLIVSDATGIEGSDGLVNRVYPNPASDKVNFEFAISGDVLLEVYDMEGRVMKSLNGSGSKLTLDISDLSDNIFLYSVTIDGQTSFGKLIKE